MNNDIIILTLVGALAVDFHHDGPMTNPHTIESHYSTQNVCEVTTPVSGSCPTGSWTYFHTGQWTGW